MRTITIFEKPPKDFQEKAAVSGCFCVYSDTILLLKRHPNSPQGMTWGIPAGKLEQGESPLEAVIRELHEEVGLRVLTQDLQPVGSLYARLPSIDYTFHMFCTHFTEKPLLQINDSEHLDFGWFTFDEATKLPLILGAKEAFIYYRNFMKNRRFWS